MAPSGRLLLPRASALDAGAAGQAADALDDSTDALDIGGRLDQRKQPSVSERAVRAELQTTQHDEGAADNGTAIPPRLYAPLSAGGWGLGIMGRHPISTRC